MKNNIITSAIFAALSVPASAIVTIDWVTVGDAGNAADPATGSIFGAVAYGYRIARNETTIAQYAAFLNAVAATDTYGLYNSSMASDGTIKGIQRIGTSGSFSYSVIGSGNRPITYVSWFDAARFANWTHNGQPTGAQNAATTEDGAYTLNGVTNSFNIVAKNPNATVWIPSQNEWFKAAYYDPTKNVTGGYWLHATQSDTMSSNSPTVAGAANYYDGDYAVTQSSAYSSSQNYLMDVGAYGSGSQSYYGTNDQAGNVIEWNSTPDLSAEGSGGYYESGEPSLRSTAESYQPPGQESWSTGFRLAAAIPEPTTGLLAILGLFPLFSRRRKA